MYHAAVPAAIEGAVDLVRDETRDAVLSHEWKFEIGNCATHVSQPLPSLIIWRCKAGSREVYGVRSFMEVDEVRDRIIMSDSLRVPDIDGRDCGCCLLRQTGLCPRG